jgi:diguanylate cyclase (GGDEF)-like protein
MITLLTTMIPLFALNFIAPMIGGVVLAATFSFFVGVMLAKKSYEQTAATLAERQVHGLEAEVRRLHRERMGDQLEAQLLQEFFGQSDIASALGAYLRRIVPQPSSGFAAIVGTGTNSSGATIGRGLSEASIRHLAIPDAVIRRLKTGSPLTLKPSGDGASLFEQLDAVDRNKTSQLYLAPFDVGDDIFAVLVTSSLWPSGLTEEEQFTFTRRVIRQLATRWQQTLVVEQKLRELRSTRNMLELRGIADAETVDPLESLERFAARLCEFVQADRAAVYFVARRAGEQLQPIVQCGRPLGPGTETVWQRHEQSLARATIDLEHGSLHDAKSLRNLKIDSLIANAAAMPIRVNGRVLGAICLTTRAPGNALTEGQSLIEFAAETLSRTLRRIFDDATIRKQARHDHLTNLVNRRSFDASLATEVERVQRGESPGCSLLMADLDRFKSVNDQYGHQGGDHVLRETARILTERVSRTRMGEQSIVARYGGEEFAILLPNFRLAGALRVAEEIRAAIEAEPIRIHDIEMAVTISIGVADCPRQSGTVESLIAIADKALYQAKSNGRNRVCHPAGVVG